MNRADGEPAMTVRTASTNRREDRAATTAGTARTTARSDRSGNGEESRTTPPSRIQNPRGPRHPLAPHTTPLVTGPRTARTTAAAARAPPRDGGRPGSRTASRRGPPPSQLAARRRLRRPRHLRRAVARRHRPLHPRPLASKPERAASPAPRPPHRRGRPGCAKGSRSARSARKGPRGPQGQLVKTEDEQGCPAPDRVDGRNGRAASEDGKDIREDTTYKATCIEINIIIVQLK